jgi:hypothetical protein
LRRDWLEAFSHVVSARNSCRNKFCLSRLPQPQDRELLEGAALRTPATLDVGPSSLREGQGATDAEGDGVPKGGTGALIGVACGRFDASFAEWGGVLERTF